MDSCSRRVEDFGRLIYNPPTLLYCSVMKGDLRRQIRTRQIFEAVTLRKVQTIYCAHHTMWHWPVVASLISGARKP